MPANDGDVQLSTGGIDLRKDALDQLGRGPILWKEQGKATKRQDGRR